MKLSRILISVAFASTLSVISACASNVGSNYTPFQSKTLPSLNGRLVTQNFGSSIGKRPKKKTTLLSLLSGKSTGAGSTPKKTAQEEYDTLFSGKVLNPQEGISVKQLVSGNTLYLHDQPGILMGAKYFHPDGSFYFMYLPKSNLLKGEWTANGNQLCYLYKETPPKRCYTLKKNQEGGLSLYDGNKSSQRLIRAVEGDSKGLMGIYTANADYYDAEARDNASKAPGYKFIWDALQYKDQLEAEERERLCRENFAEYKRRYCQGAWTCSC